MYSVERANGATSDPSAANFRASDAPSPGPTPAITPVRAVAVS